MKIAVVSDYFYPMLGGISEHVFNFVKYALAAGHDVKIITPSPWTISKKRIKQLDAASFGDRIIRFGHHLPVFSNASLSRVGIALNTGKKLKKLFADEKFDIIHIHSPLAGFIPMIANNRSDTLTVGTIHTYFKSNFWFSTLKKTILKYYDALDGCIAVSESCRELIEKMLDRTPVVIPNGIDVNVFGTTSEKIPQFCDGKVNVFFIGRADRRNGIDVLIRAFLSGIKKFKNMRLIIAGGGPYMPMYKKMVPKEHDDDIVFVGSIHKERPAYYNTADIHVFPAEIATFSITVLEGLAAGKPVISTDMASFKEIMTDGKEGFLVPYGNVALLEEKILLLARDEKLRESMGRAARKRGEECSWEHITDRIIAFYQDVYNRAISKYPRV
jgi:phosphatidylinositol alpha-mannosyltransferase